MSKDLNDHVDRMMSYAEEGKEGDKKVENKVATPAPVPVPFQDYRASSAEVETPAANEGTVTDRPEMELIDYLLILNRRKWVILTTLFFTLIIVALWIIQTPTKYTATSVVRVSNPRAGSAEFVDYNTDLGEKILGTYVQLATSNNVLQELSKSVDRIPVIKAQALAGTELFEITAEDPDPGLAQFAANKVAEILIAQGKDIMTDSATAIKVYIAEPAAMPTLPSSPSPWLIIGLGIVVGALGGVGLALLFDGLDTRLYSDRQIEALVGHPVIGNIPAETDTNQDGVLLFESGKSTHTEAFRRLRTNIFSPVRGKPMKSILITSAVPKDGKSSTAANLAVSLVQANRSVLIIDANLRYPSIHSFFTLPNTRGLTNILMNEIELPDALQNTKYPNLKIIGSGAEIPNPVESLDSGKMAMIIEQASRMFDYVLVDSPASNSVTDPAVLAPKVDGVLLIVRHGWVRREALQSTIRQLKAVSANVIGVVSNRTDLGTRSQILRSHHAN